ncbi:MAG: FAD-dependent oxidoreductase [Phycisphaerales bacterium]
MPDAPALPDLITHLPPHLAERARPLADRPIPAAPHFVLVWLHHALRAEENPALDTAIALANRLALPVLAYQGLAGNHRYNADRHHAFILESARDLHAALERRGIGHILHVPTDPRTPSPLPALTRRAAALIVEDFPAPPFPRWTQRIAEKAASPVLAIDAACVIPMRSHARWYDRAFKFESKTSAEFHKRTRRQWPPIEPAHPWTDAHQAALPDIPSLHTVDTRTMGIAHLCARCAIDHTIPPIPHTPGGSTAGYARWQRFRDHHLHAYAKRRNDAASLHAVSRLSPHLHYGTVAPTRIAREAAEQPSEGAAKFLNELLVWRELAHAFCFWFEGDPESTQALPEWARQSLARHADDPRTTLDWETLARARTGDPLWDAAQTSLLRQGELHNNIRMTWGKAIPLWTRTPSDALRTLFDLNHRYALDGSDPNSYGGLLWCLGQFDRPFEPESPVLGAIRPRDTATHAQRLDLNRYRAIVCRPRAARIPSIAIIGAGIAGLAAARTLADQGIPIRVFDKGRGPGGRCSTRFENTLRFDHGAAYLTAHDPRFARFVDAWRERGLVQPWAPRLASLTTDATIHATIDATTTTTPEHWLAPPEGMHAINAHLAADLSVSFGTRIHTIAREQRQWALLDEHARTIARADILICNAPPAQAATLLDPIAPDLARRATAIPFDPCWALMLATHRTHAHDPPPFDAARAANPAANPAAPIAWISRENSKPGRDTPTSTNTNIDTWVIHASPEWSRRHLELEAPEAAQHLRALAARAIPALEAHPPTLIKAHRWRYALCAAPWDDDCHYDPDRAIGLCGDWFASCARHGRIETAFLSGAALAARILATIADKDPNHTTSHAPTLFDTPAPTNHT